MHGESVLFYFTKTIKLLYIPTVLCIYQSGLPQVEGSGQPYMQYCIGSAAVVAVYMRAEPAPWFPA